MTVFVSILSPSCYLGYSLGILMFVCLSDFFGVILNGELGPLLGVILAQGPQISSPGAFQIRARDHFKGT